MDLVRGGRYSPRISQQGGSVPMPMKGTQVKSLRVAVFAVIAVLVFAGSPSTADAHHSHWVYVYNNSGHAIGTAQSQKDCTFCSMYVHTCDWVHDGLGIRTHLLATNGSIKVGKWATPGADCWKGTKENADGYTWFRVCAQLYGCTAWHRLD